MKNLKAWMRIASTDEQIALAKAAGTSRGYLYHLANDTKSYAREANPKLARRIEAAAETINGLNPRLPRILRTDLNSACRECDFAEKCLGRDVIIESEFEMIDERAHD